MALGKLSPEEIKERIENHFLPHSAYVEIFDYRYRIRFQVRYETDDSLVLCTMSELIIHNIDNEQSLREVLDFAKEQVEQRLAPTPPAIPRPHREYDPHGEV